MSDVLLKRFESALAAVSNAPSPNRPFGSLQATRDVVGGHAWTKDRIAHQIPSSQSWGQFVPWECSLPPWFSRPVNSALPVNHAVHMKISTKDSLMCIARSSGGSSPTASKSVPCSLSVSASALGIAAASRLVGRPTAPKGVENVGTTLSENRRGQLADSFALCHLPYVRFICPMSDSFALCHARIGQLPRT